MRDTIPVLRQAPLKPKRDQSQNPCEASHERQHLNIVFKLRWVHVELLRPDLSVAFLTGGSKGRLSQDFLIPSQIPALPSMVKASKPALQVQVRVDSEVAVFSTKKT